MPTMSRRRRAIESDLEAQISDLRDELASMASMLSKQGSAAYDETRGAARFRGDDMRKNKDLKRVA